jgi:hypothetical protein
MTRISTWGVRALVAAAAALPMLTVAAPAGADQLRYRDATGDVQKFDLGQKTFKPVADPAATNGDIKDVFVHYRTGRLVIRANYVDLAPRLDTTLSFTGELRTNAHRWLYSVDTSPARYAGHDQLRTFRHFRKACEIGHKVDYRENYTRVVVPLSCLHNPRWVKVSVGAVTVQLDEKALKEFFENADANQMDSIPAGIAVIRGDDAGQARVADRLRWTPRIYR